jgi:quinol monooxygenase YgiN
MSTTYKWETKMSVAPLTIIAITTAVSGEGRTLRAAQEKLVAETLNEPGCLRYELNQSLDDPHVLVFTEQWASEREWRAHMEGAAMQRFTASGAPNLIADFQLYRMHTVPDRRGPEAQPKANLRKKLQAALTLGALFVALAWGHGAFADSATNALPSLINPSELKWEKTIPVLGEKSPEYAMLHVDPKTHLTMLMFRTPVAVRIKPHTHKLAETHVVLQGGTHVFEANGVRYNIEKGGFLRMPGGTVHEAWLPAGSLTLNIEESGWVVNWLHGGPSAEDIDQLPPPASHPQ